jgi:hypothetical protein
MSAPTIVDSPIADKPLVNPEWRVDKDDDSVLNYCDNAHYGMAAWITGRELVVWRPVYADGKLLREPRNGRSLDECKRLCERALRDAGYAFVGDPEPLAAKPEPKGRIVRKWVKSGEFHRLFAEPGELVAYVSPTVITVWPLGGGRSLLDSIRPRCMPVDEARAKVERAFTEAGYELVDPPAEPQPAPCTNPACDCGDLRPDDRITLPDCDGIEILPDGAKQSKLAERCDLLPPRAVLAVARVMHEGAVKYGDSNWFTIPVASHLNHAVRHVLLYLSGDRQEKHLEHAACRALMALEKYLRDADAPP